MSVSPTSKTDKDFVDIEFRPKPTENEAGNKDAAVKDTTKAPEKDGKQNGTGDKVPSPAPQEPAKTDASPTGEAPAADAGNKQIGSSKKNGGWAAILLDAFLIILLIGVIGCGGYYLKKELDRYRVPSAMEIALEENHQLSLKRESLQADYYHADEQIHMRKTLARLNSQLDGIKHDISLLEGSIEDQKNNILALQHEIRQADTDSRSVARSLLPGMAIGTATTTTGKSIRNAFIYRLVNNKTIDIRSNEGQVRVPIKDLVKDSLPPMARYAFGLDDLVDMSDFGLQAPAALAAPAKLVAPKADPAPTKPAAGGMADYEPAAGAPVVDTDANKTSTTGTPEDPVTPANTSFPDSWQAPTGDIPL